MDWIFVLRLLTLLLLVVVCFEVLRNQKKLGRFSKYFSIAMVLILIPNLISFTLDIMKIEFSTTIFFVIFVNILGFLFFFIYFYKIQKMPIIRKVQRFLISLFLIAVVGTIVGNGKGFFLEFPMFFYFFQTFLLLIFIGMFFYDTFNSDLILDIKNYFPFWVSLSLIIIYVGIIPIMLFIHKVNVEVNRNVFFLILYLINLIGYSIMLYGIIKSKVKLESIMKDEGY